jgi:hypothetical protein
MFLRTPVGLINADTIERIFVSGREIRLIQTHRKDEGYEILELFPSQNEAWAELTRLGEKLCD